MKTRNPLPRVRVLSRDEGKVLLDSRARAELHMSGPTFIRRWKAGQFKRCVRPAAQRLAMLIPFAQ